MPEPQYLNSDLKTGTGTPDAESRVPSSNNNGPPSTLVTGIIEETLPYTLATTNMTFEIGTSGRDETIDEHGISGMNEMMDEYDISRTDETMDEHGISGPDETIDEHGISGPDETIDEHGISGPDETIDEHGILGPDETIDEHGILGTDETIDEHSLCGICGGLYRDGKDWIQCDYCSKWFHRRCGGLSNALKWKKYTKANVQYKCPTCSDVLKYNGIFHICG
jgi:hypothetical protein